MYSEWVSLQPLIQTNKDNESVLDSFPVTVGKEVACSVVRNLTQSLSVPQGNNEPSNLTSGKHVDWTMQVICYGLSLPFNTTSQENEAVRDCVHIYCEWLSALTTPKMCVPKPILDQPNTYAQTMLHHLYNLFVPRQSATPDHVKRQALLCHRVLRNVQSMAQESTIINKDTWEVLLRFLLAITDTLLAPPKEKEDIGDQLCERILSVLFEVWLLACHRCFPSPSLWRTFRDMCSNWRHHEALVVQWHRVNAALTSRLLKNMYGPSFPVLQIPDEDSLVVPASMDRDCVAQSWFRFLHILSNPIDLCHPETISQTPKFMVQALASDVVVDPSQHACLKVLPHIFFKSMKGVSVMVDAFLGIAQELIREDVLPTPQATQRQSVPPGQSSSSTLSTPPSTRRMKAISVAHGSVTSNSRYFYSVRHPKGVAQKVASLTIATKPPAVVPIDHSAPCEPLMMTLDGRPPIDVNRPKCNSILHLFGAWLFDAALAGVKLHETHSGPSSRRTSSFMDATDGRARSLPPEGAVRPREKNDDSYDYGRAEACGTLCRIFCAHKTGEEILPEYLSRFYITLYYGLVVDENLSGQVLSNIIFNGIDLLRIDLDGVSVLVPQLLSAIEVVLSDLKPKFKCHDQIPVVELRRASIHLLLSMLCMPLHYNSLQIQDILKLDEKPEQPATFLSLRLGIVELLLRALFVETDPINTQMLLGGLLLCVQDQALLEAAQSTGGTTFNSDSPTSDTAPEESMAEAETESSGSKNHGLKHFDTAHGLFGQAASLVCNRLMASWKIELNVALAAMEVLCGLAKVHLDPPNSQMCKRTVKWICDFIVYQCSRPAPAHSRDLHSMIVAAYSCLTLWLVQHDYLMQDRQCLHTVLEVVELGISGTKSQHSLDQIDTPVVIDRHSKSVNYSKNRASDPPKLKGEKELMPASMRVKDAAEAVLTTIIDQVGSFPPPCGPESLCSLLDEEALANRCHGDSVPERDDLYKYYVLENSIILALIDHPSTVQNESLPTVTALIRGPFGRHAWTMQLRHQPRAKGSVNIPVKTPSRPTPCDTLGRKSDVQHRYFPPEVDDIPLTKADMSIPSMKSVISRDKEHQKLLGMIAQQVQFEKAVSQRAAERRKNRPFPNPDTECKPPSTTTNYQTARLFLSHYGFLTLQALKEASNSSVPPSLVMLDGSSASGLRGCLQALDAVSSRTYDTVHLYYVKSGQCTPQEILQNVANKGSVHPHFLEFIRSLGWPIDVNKHAGWTGHVSTSWRIVDDSKEKKDYPPSTGGSLYDGRHQALYWADVSSEIAFIVPSLDTYQLQSMTDSSLVTKDPTSTSQSRSDMTTSKSDVLLSVPKEPIHRRGSSYDAARILSTKKVNDDSPVVVSPGTHKRGSSYDTAKIMSTSTEQTNQIRQLNDLPFTGEVSLNGDKSMLRPKPGMGVPDRKNQVLALAAKKPALSQRSVSAEASNNMDRVFQSSTSTESFKVPKLTSKSLSLDFERPHALSKIDSRDALTPTAESTMAGATSAVKARRYGRHSSSSVALDNKIMVVWLESYEDYENFPLAELALGTTGTGREGSTGTGREGSTSASLSKDLLVIFIHALKSGLFRIHIHGQPGRIGLAIPLWDGMVVSRRALGDLVRQTALNNFYRKRLDHESYHPPHVKRKLKIQEIVQKYRCTMSEPAEFYTSLFHKVLRQTTV